MSCLQLWEMGEIGKKSFHFSFHVQQCANNIIDYIFLYMYYIKIVTQHIYYFWDIYIIWLHE
jgi:hypothetical protein